MLLEGQKMSPEGKALRGEPRDTWIPVLALLLIEGLVQVTQCL